MNKTNKVLLRIGIIAAVCGISSGYASEQAWLGTSQSLPKTSSVGATTAAQGPYSQFSNSMDKLPSVDHVKNPSWINVTKLMTMAQPVFGGIQVQRVDSYKVLLSKPLPELASTEIYAAILYYEQVDTSKWKDIFGNTGLFGNSYDSDSNDFVYIYDTHRGDVRECPQGLIKIQNIGLVKPNITISPDRMTISWNPVAHYFGIYTSDEHGGLIKEDKDFKYYRDNIVLNKTTGEIVNQPE